MKKVSLLEQYLIDVNTVDATPEQKIKRLQKSMIKNLECFLIKVIGVSLGIYTFKVAVEQLVMQLNIKF